MDLRLILTSISILTSLRICDVLRIPDKSINLDQLEKLFHYSLKRTINRVTFIFSDDDTEYKNLKVSRILKLVPVSVSVVLISFEIEPTVESDFWFKYYNSIGSVARTLFIIYPPERNNSLLLFLNNTVLSHAKVHHRLGSSRFLVLVTVNQSSDEIKRTLKFAWLSKFLDLSILEMEMELENERCSSRINSYNPFYRKYRRDCITEIKSLFPDKLRNLNGWVINVGMVHLPPVTSVDPETYQVNGTDFAVMKLLSEFMNFQLNVTGIFIDFQGPTANNFTYSNYQNLLETSEIDLIGNQITLRSYPKLRISVSMETDSICALIPIIHHVTPNVIVADVTVPLLFFVLVCAIVFISRRYLSFDKYYWDLYYISGIFINIVTPRLPRKLYERVLFASIVFTALIYSNILIKKLMIFKLSGDKLLALDTIPDMDKVGLTPIMYSHFYDRLFDPDDRFLVHLREEMSRKELADMDFEECLEVLLRHQNVSCITTESIQRAIVNQKRKSVNGEIPMRISKPCFWSGAKAIMFEPHTPYVRKFNHYLLLIAAAGLNLPIGEEIYEDFKNPRISETFEVGDKDLVLQMSIILVSGYLLSLVILVIEVYKQRRKARIRRWFE